MSEIKTIKIGNQIWMSENLNFQHFQNGDEVPFFESIVDFLKQGRHQKPACCFYQNNSEKGVLYNSYVISDLRQIAPDGFRVPTVKNWLELIDFAGGENIASQNLKSNSGWTKPDENSVKPEIIVEDEIGNGTNLFGFDAKPMGALLKTEMLADFFGFGSDAYFWTADTTIFYSGYAHNVFMYYYSSKILLHTLPRRLGLSIRCIKNL